MSKFFPFRVDPFQKGFDNEESKQEVKKVISCTSQEHNFYKFFFFFFNSKELSILLQFVNLTSFSYLLICAIFSSPEQCSWRAIVLPPPSSSAAPLASASTKVFVKVFKTSLFPNLITDLLHLWLMVHIGPKFCAVPSPPL